MSRVTATIDKAKLERSIKRYAAKLGESNAQAVIRWSVQTCLEVAKYNQPFNGKASVHRNTIRKDINNCVVSIKGRTPRGQSALKTTQEIIDWVDLNRIKRGRRVPKLPIQQRKKATESMVNKVVRIKMERAGMARGAWIGAGNEIGRHQRGSNRISIGVNRYKFAQKHTGLGRARRPIPGFNPIAVMKNLARHSSSEYVLRKDHIYLAIADGRKKCLNYYRKTLAAINRSKP